MTSDSQTIVHAVYDALDRRDLAALAHLMDPDVVCVLSDEIPYGGVARGPDAVVDVVRRWLAAYEDVRVDIAEIIATGDTVVVLGHTHGRAVGGGNLWQPIAHVLRLRGGRIVHFTNYGDSMKELRALGMVPPPRPPTALDLKAD